MSFSSLPPELVHQIIGSTVPHTFHSTTHHKRQETLCRLSLVSRQFRSIARPLLLEIAWLDQNERLKRLLGEDSEVAFRVLVFEVGVGLSPSFVGRTIGSSPNLRSLTIQSVDSNVINLSVLSSCKNLVNLQLSGYDFDATSLDALPSLQALSLNYEAVGGGLELLDPLKVPALRALGLDNIYLQSELEDLERTRIDKLLPQLDALCIEIDLYRLAKDTLLSNLEPRILIDAGLNDILSEMDDCLSTIQHLRIKLDHLVQHLGRSEAIRAVNQILESDQQSKSSQLRSIYLDSAVRPAQSDAEEIHEKFAKMEVICRKADIEVVLEAQMRDYALDSFVSGEFCRRQRKSRESKQLVQV
ncbi:hypothetical protein JCM5350_007572 [Sporobolomyces pararoseus]